MMRIEGEILTMHRNPAVVAETLSPDNLNGMETVAGDGTVRTVIAGTRLRSILASVDDYLMNLSVVEDLCTHIFS